jgi:hypothetical protein
MPVQQNDGTSKTLFVFETRLKKLSRLRRRKNQTFITTGFQIKTHQIRSTLQNKRAFVIQLNQLMRQDVLMNTFDHIKKT